MFGLIKGEKIPYSGLSWQQLCDERLLIVHEPEKDLINPPQLNEETQRDRERSLAKLSAWLDFWSKSWFYRLTHQAPSL